ncbi:MAG TPA: hypothetical protein DCE73_13545 [Paraprevotella xylaniphila]|nr:hypothetical protein [Paraprevotella xylaniphila]
MHAKTKEHDALYFFVFCVTAEVPSPGSAEDTGMDVIGRRLQAFLLYSRRFARMAYFLPASGMGANIRFWIRFEDCTVKI